jgi:signal-transduction protein with cAMP-binding, CBS, and nucleotidyltransferase domain
MVKTVQEVMLPEPLAVDAQVSIKVAAHMMRRWDTPDVFVTDNGYLRGVLSDRDISVFSIAADRHPATTRSGECCDPNPQWVSADDSTDHAIELMHQHGLRRLPVVRDGRLVGVVWIGDLAVASTTRHRSSSHQ